MGVLCWENLDYQILNNLSGSTRTNQIMALMGPSGSGKSTMLNAIYYNCLYNIKIYFNIDISYSRINYLT